MRQVSAPVMDSGLHYVRCRFTRFIKAYEKDRKSNDKLELKDAMLSK